MSIAENARLTAYPRHTGVSLTMSYFDSAVTKQDFANDAYISLPWDTNTQGIAGFSQTQQDYPMFVTNAAVISSIAQSSPDQCDDNTITVTVSVLCSVIWECVRIRSVGVVSVAITVCIVPLGIVVGEDIILVSVAVFVGISPTKWIVREGITV